MGKYIHQLNNNIDFIKPELRHHNDRHDEYKFLINLKIFSWNIKIGGIVNKAKKITLISN